MVFTIIEPIPFWMGDPDEHDDDEWWLWSRSPEVSFGFGDSISCLMPPLDFINSAASAFEMFSCFFHFVRRFWNQIFTWKAILRFR